MSDGSILQLESHDGRWGFIRPPTTIMRTIKKVNTNEYEIHIIKDGILEIAHRFPTANDAFIKHKFLSATLGLKRKR
jgi:hypothetical protein